MFPLYGNLVKILCENNFISIFKYKHSLIKMVKINPLNVVQLLYDDVSLKFKSSSPVNSKEIELKDQFLGKCY